MKVYRETDRIFKEIITLKEDIKKTHKELEEKTRKALKKGFKRYFKKYPYVEAIFWVQKNINYTFVITEAVSMSFNSYIAWQKENSVIGQYEGDIIVKEIKYGGPQTYIWKWKSNKEPEKIYRLLNFVENRYLQSIFGFDVRVIATRNGFDIHENELIASVA